jgi:hypothetical protein
MNHPPKEGYPWKLRVRVSVPAGGVYSKYAMPPINPFASGGRCVKTTPVRNPDTADVKIGINPVASTTHTNTPIGEPEAVNV